MRTGLTPQQTAILNATVKKTFWLFEIDRDNNGVVDYYWSTQGRDWSGHTYVARIMFFTPLILAGGNPELGIIPPTKITVHVTFKDHNIGGFYASAFEGAAVTVRLIGSTVADGEAELMSWRFKVAQADSLDQILALECQDWLTLHLEGDYPNTPLVSNLFPADIMKDDNVCVPLAFGVPFFPVRWLTKSREATYVDADTFTVAGNQTALFSAGQFLLANCGADGIKSGWVLSSSYASTTTVNLTAVSDDLTANLTAVSTDHYLLGAAGTGYTVNRARTPHEVNFKTTYLDTNYIFKQDTLTGSDGVSYKAMQLLCDDANKDNTNDANGFWGVIGKEIYDLPCRFSRDDLVNKTNPANIADWVFKDWGIPASEIDDTSRAAAAAIFTARGFYLRIGLWYKMPREKFLSRLFTISGMIPVYRDKIGFKVLTKVSQMTIVEDMVKPGTFQISRTFTQKEKDSGYVTWQKQYEPVDQVNKSLVAAKSSTAKPSDVVVEGEWVQSVEIDPCGNEATRAGKLALQRILLKSKNVTFTANSKFLVLEPGDMITVNPQNFGAEGSAYDCLITRMSIQEGLWVDVECIRFSDALDDWGDLPAGDLVADQANTDRGCSPVYQGPTDASGAAGTATNVITRTVQIGAGGVLATNEAPETSGGFKATNTELTCYNTSGAIRFRVRYAGADQGDVEIGDYVGGRGIKWDQGDTKLLIKVDAAGGVSVTGGGDITLIGSNTDPGRIRFAGTSYAVEIGGDADGNRFLIKPTTNNVVDFHAGINGAWWGEPDARFRDIRLYATRQGFLSCGDWAGAVNGAAVEVDGDVSDSEPAITFTLYDKTSQTLRQYLMYHDYFRPLGHKLQDLGDPSAAWDDAYADDWHNVADFFFLDRRRERLEGGPGDPGDPGAPGDRGALVPVDDLEVIRAIRPSGLFDPRTGFELIDDATLPEWLLARDKGGQGILRDPQGRPYLSVKTMISLCLGAIRQLDRKIKTGKGVLRFAADARRGEGPLRDPAGGTA